MELALTIEDLESLPKQQEDFIVKPLGFLNSKYKNIVNESLNNASSNSIYGIRQCIKSSQYQFTSAIETVLKVSVFTVLIMMIFS